MIRFALRTALPLLLAACGSSFDLAPTEEDTAIVADVDADTDLPDSDSAAVSPASFLGVAGILTIADGAVVPESSTIDLVWHDATGELCARTLGVTAAAASAIPDGVDVLAWWELTLAAAPDRECPYAAPALSLGLSPYDERLDSAADADGLAPARQSLYGLVGRVGAESPAFLFGVAGTAEQFAGAVDTVLTDNVPDGAYLLEPLYLLPLP